MPATTANPSASDIYLHLQTKRAGKVKGEATAADHENDIVVRGWRWGATASSALGSTQSTARRSYQALTIVKGFDAASTALLAALATNDEVREAKLTMRKAGDGQMDYLTITLTNARVASIEHQADNAGGAVETVGFLFTKVAVDYVPQLASGGRGGSRSFEDEILPSS